MDFRAYVRARVPPLALAREPEILDELAQHLADLYQEGLADGLSHEAALARASTALPEYPEVLAHEIRLANRALPGIIAGRWTMPDEAGPRSPGVLSMFDDVRRDLRYAVRMLARTLGFTAVVVLTMALGIGANTVIFSAVDAILLRSAPVVDPDRVMSVYTSGERAPFQSSSYADFADVRDSGVLESVAAFASISVAFDASGTTDAVPGEVVSGNYFDVLGVRMATGRSFTSEEDRPETPSRVVVLSHAFWQRRFEGDGEVVGRVMAINGQPYTVIGSRRAISSVRCSVARLTSGCRWRSSQR